MDSTARPNTRTMFELDLIATLFPRLSFLGPSPTCRALSRHQPVGYDRPVSHETSDSMPSEHGTLLSAYRID